MMDGLVVLAGDPDTLHRWNPHGEPCPPSELCRQVAAAHPYAVVQLVGVLDVAAVDAVCAALLTFLADQPAAVVLDLTRLTASEPDALALFGATVQESRRWPAGRLIISTTPDAPADPYWADAELSISCDPAETMALLAEVGPATDSHLTLDPVIGSAKLAREFTDDCCSRWGVPEVVESARIAVTEMVNNVVAHAGTPMALRLRPHEGGLQLSVRDHSTRQPSITGPASPTSIGGRGLLLIDMVAREWGTSRLTDGKVVWALFDAEDEQRD